MAGPLDGVLVVERGTTPATGFCGRLLAGFGATVVKIEPPEPDPTRSARVVDGAPVPHPDQAPMHLYLGMGKRSLTSRLVEADSRRLRSIIGSVDVVLTDEPHTLTDIGLGYDALAAEHPSLVYTAVTPFGSWGPYSRWRGENITAFGMGGQMSLTGEPDREPLCTASEQGAWQAGLAAFASTCLALYARTTNGLGQYVDVAAMEVMAGALEGFGPTARTTGTTPRRSGTHRVSMMGVYPCADGHAGIFALPRQFELLATLLSRPEMPEGLRVSSADEIRTRIRDLKTIIGTFFELHTRKEIRELARSSRVPMAPVATIADVADNEHLVAREFWFEHDVSGRTVRMPGPLLRMTRTPWQSRPAPQLGEMSWTELESLASRRDPLPEPSRLKVREPSGEVEGARPVRLDRPASGPLAHLRVVDMTAYWLGPYCCKWLRDFGAEVIKVESPQRIDFVRTLGATRDQDRWWNRSPYFNNYNRGKQSLGIDPTHPDGRQVILDLVARSDVLVENFAAGYMEGIGLSYDALRVVRPDLVMLSASGYGAWGPDSPIAGVGTNMEQLSGIASLNAYSDAPQPYNSGIAYADPTGGTAATAAVLMALMHRDRTGEGQWIDLAGHEVLVSLVGDQLAALSLGLTPVPKGNAHPDMAPHGCYPCAGEDRWVTIAVREDAAWPRLAELIGRPELGEKLLTLDDRRRETYEIDVAIMTWTVLQDADEAAAQLQRIGVAAGPVRTTSDLVDDPHLRVRGYYETVEDPDQGAWPHDGVAWRLSRTPGRVWGPAPRLGEHTREILSTLLGRDELEIDKLYASGAAGEAPTR